MLTFHGTDAAHAIVTFYGAHSASLPDHIRAKLTEVIATNDLLGTIIASMESLYAARGDIPADGIELLDGLARFVSANNFYGKAVRAGQISGVAQRIAGGGEAVDADDPAIEEGFGEPVAEVLPVITPAPVGGE